MKIYEFLKDFQMKRPVENILKIIDYKKESLAESAVAKITIITKAYRNFNVKIVDQE